MAPRKLRPEESWNSVHRSEASGDVSNDDFLYPEEASMNEESRATSQRSLSRSPSIPTIKDIRRALHPLQAAADRVGKQVEQFAENLDRLSRKQSKVRPKEKEDCRRVLPLVHGYQRIANETVKHLRTLHAPDGSGRRRRLPKRKARSSNTSSRRASSTSSDNDFEGLTTLADLKRWEEEERTWDLLSSMLQVERPVTEVDDSHADPSHVVRPRKRSDLCRYSPETEIWDNFLATDDLAWQQHNLVEWLRRSADHSGDDIAQTIKQSEGALDEDLGIAAHGWLYTREAIKGQKRLRSSARPLEPKDPGIETSLLTSDKRESLATQLDPDATTRQALALEKQDLRLERALWMACWEMLRRGKPWTFIVEWFSERSEQWRAVIMRGTLCLNASSTSDSLDCQSHFLSRRMCALAARDGGIDKYENAVYGLLGGDLTSVQKISSSWNDQLFAHYNSYLAQSFEQYVARNYPCRIPSNLLGADGLLNISPFAGQRAYSSVQLIEKLRLGESTRDEATKPYKMLQGSLMAKTFDDFVFRQGVQISQLANAKGPSRMVPPMSVALIEGSVTSNVTLENHEFIRLVVHIILVFQELGHDFGNSEHSQAIENFLAIYVDFLGKAGKQQLLPLYASRLSHQRSIVCLGRQMPAIQQHDERVNLMKLMKQYRLDIPMILHKQLELIISDSLPDHTTPTTYPDLRILEKGGNKPGEVRRIAEHFIVDEISDDQIDLIHGFEWYMLLDGCWRQTMAVGVAVYKHLLRCRALAAARTMSQNITFSRISLSKSRAMLGRTIDLSRWRNEGGLDSSLKRLEQGDLDESVDHRPAELEEVTRTQEYEVLLDQAAGFRDFENLFVALNAIQECTTLGLELNELVG